MWTFYSKKAQSLISIPLTNLDDILFLKNNLMHLFESQNILIS